MRVRAAVLIGIFCWASWVAATSAAPPTDAPPTDAQGEVSKVDFFERNVRPLLLRRCGECHVDDQSGGLSLGSREALLRGGDSGPAIVPGDILEGRLIAAIRRQDDAPMPPDEPLPEEEIRILEHWVEQGAAWSPDLPKLAADAQTADQEAGDHWAFQPIVPPSIPSVTATDWPRTAIDPFVLRRLEDAGLAPSPEADRATLIRRVSYSLTGLPPTLEEVDAFVTSELPDAYEQLIERLLDSPRYGQHQARLWLDLARYSDTKGYVYAREERFWVHAWNYRDWVVAAMNQDLPYDRFLLLQIAADQVPDRAPDDLAAMGFLTLGRRFLGVKHDIIDDRIDVLCRGTMGLTVSCARCHNHKYDPIPTADYYSLYGVFDSSSEHLAPLSGAHSVIDDPQSDVHAKLETLRTTVATRRKEQADRVRRAIGDYLFAQTELHKYPADGFDQVFAKEDLLPAFVRRFQAYLEQAEGEQDTVFVAWRAYRSLDSDRFAEAAAAVTESLQKDELGPVNQHVLAAFAESPTSMREVADRYASLFAAIEQAAPDQAAPEQAALTEEDPDAEQLRDVLYGADSPCEVPDRGVVHIESYFDSGTTTELWKLQGDLDRAILQAGEAAPFAVTLVDNRRPTEPRIFRRGNPLDQGAREPRHFLSLFSDGPPEPFAQGSGRLELAQRIVDPQNPLTARVMVNRVWAQHFGAGLVTTTSDFGRRAQPPSHPELLDYLADRFVREGWSLKNLHRWILLSATYRQNSYGPDDAQQRVAADELDPANRLLWRMNPHRLTFEEMRDSVLAAGGTLDERVGGKPAPILQPPFSNRRTLYALVDRQFLPSSFRVFDFASPDLHISQRNETIIPQQALFLMNHPFVVHEASQLASDFADSQDPLAVVDALFARVLKRRPTEAERREAVTLLASVGPSAQPTPQPTAQDWHYGFGTVDEQAASATGQPGTVVGFTPLPYFSGTAWQGGASYPDPMLGWTQLTAIGGHPGNDRQHASIRRWTAPRATTIHVRSELKHDPAAGDGIRAFVISSRQGLLHSTKRHQDAAPINLDSLQVAAGESIDFVVDIDEVLNSDQFLWTIEIEADGNSANGDSGDAARHWNSSKDFPTPTPTRLSPAAQLAQVLMCTNEFMFVD